eukprot:49929-Amphidinium_carterae.1
MEHWTPPAARTEPRRERPIFRYTLPYHPSVSKLSGARHGVFQESSAKTILQKYFGNDISLRQAWHISNPLLPTSGHQAADCSR